MKVTSRRMAVARLLLSIPIAFAVVAALSSSGAVGSCGDNPAISLNCNGGGGGGGSAPTPCVPQWTAHASGSDAWIQVVQNNEYDDNVTVRGYRTDSCTGGSYGLDSVFARTEGDEFCDVGIQTDWDKTQTSPAGPNSWTLNGYGGYASSGCLLGHYIEASAEAGAQDSETGLTYNLGHGGWFAIPPGNGAIEGSIHCLDLWLPPGMDDPCSLANNGGPGFP